MGMMPSSASLGELKIAYVSPFPPLLQNSQMSDVIHSLGTYQCKISSRFIDLHSNVKYYMDTFLDFCHFCYCHEV